jgi:hypothetical protein
LWTIARPPTHKIKHKNILEYQINNFKKNNLNLKRKKEKEAQ